MIYLSSFRLNEERLKDPYIYPYSVFRGKENAVFVFSEITILYGNNGCGKSTLLNVMANRLGLAGKEHASSNTYGTVDYCGQYGAGCGYSLGEDEQGRRLKIPAGSRYIKSEDILYEVKKIQQTRILKESVRMEQIRKGRTAAEADRYMASYAGYKSLEAQRFAQEKYSNGETSLRYFEEHLLPDRLYLLDEPEVSLSPANQVKLASQINQMARFLQVQFILATHSPFMLGTLQGRIYDLDAEEPEVRRWSELENVRFFYDFFKRHEREFGKEVD